MHKSPTSINSQAKNVEIKQTLLKALSNKYVLSLVLNVRSLLIALILYDNVCHKVGPHIIKHTFIILLPEVLLEGNVTKLIRSQIVEAVKHGNSSKHIKYVLNTLFSLYANAFMKWDQYVYLSLLLTGYHAKTSMCLRSDKEELLDNKRTAKGYGERAFAN